MKYLADNLTAKNSFIKKHWLKQLEGRDLAVAEAALGDFDLSRVLTLR